MEDINPSKQSFLVTFKSGSGIIVLLESAFTDDVSAERMKAAIANGAKIELLSTEAATNGFIALIEGRLH